jgi:hypothetical protein
MKMQLLKSFLHLHSKQKHSKFMKKLIFTIYLANLVCFSAVAQYGLDADISNLQTLFKKENKKESVKWLPKQKSVQIGNYIYPIAEATHVKLGNGEDEGNLVEFFMQRGTAITDIRDVKWRRAYWSITFSDKKACKEFIQLIESLKIDSEREG